MKFIQLQMWVRKEIEAKLNPFFAYSNLNHIYKKIPSGFAGSHFKTSYDYENRKTDNGIYGVVRSESPSKYEDYAYGFVPTTT